MFKIKFARNHFAKDPSKITGINIITGYQCSNFYCPYRPKCKYRKDSRLHNLIQSTYIHLENRYGISLFDKFYINKYTTDLTGSDKCPYVYK